MCIYDEGEFCSIFTIVFLAFYIYNGYIVLCIFSATEKKLIMFNLPDNNNTSVSDVYNNARTIRGLLLKGFTIKEIHNETGFPISAIEIMRDEYVKEK